MSQDIRALFANIAKKKTSTNQPRQSTRAIIVDSDDEMVEKTPETTKTKKRNKAKTSILSSDSEDDTAKLPAKKTKPSLTSVNISSILNKKITQTKPVKAEKPTVEFINGNQKTKDAKKKKKGKNTELGIHENTDFEKTLMELDDDSNDTILIDNLDLLDKTMEEALKNDTIQTQEVKKLDGEVAETKQDKKETPKKRARKKSESESTTNKKPKLEYTDSGIDPDQERYEKRRHSAALYQQYLHRGGPKHHGEKEYPEGKDNCLSNLTFLRTGVLDSLESEEFDNLIKKHGGRTVHTVSKKVNYVVVGDQPGPAKIEKARKYNIKEISEDELLDLILLKSGMKPKYVKHDSTDLGFDSFESSSSKSEKELNLEQEATKKMETEETGNLVTNRDKSLPVKVKKESVAASTHQKESVDNHESKEKQFSPIKVKKETTHDSSAEQKSVHDMVKSHPKTETPLENLCWTEKYKPKSTQDIIGQKDSNSNMHKLKKWLQNWDKNQEPERRKKLPRPSPFNQGDGEWYKAALLSGPPGVGKTTTATLVAHELGYDVVEFNASDTRNKRLLHEEISQMMQSTTVAGYISGDHNIKKKRILLMDEVDGMAGNEDRGGIAELINFIKVASFPIVCMCNNKEHQKMRTLVSYCYNLKFGKPNIQQIKGAMLSICFKENIKIKPDAVAQLIIGTGGDIRQTLNHLSMWSVDEKTLSNEMIEKESKKSHKDVVYGPWDVVRKIFSTSENKDMDIAAKSRLFFCDYSLGPLFVQENYLQVTPDCTRPKNESAMEMLIRRYKAADSLSMGDLVESKIRSANNWSLLESQAFYTTVLPSHYMSGTPGRTNFPSWLGKNSQRNKSLRMVNEIYSHSRTSVSGDKCSMRLDYAESLRNKLIKPLKNKGTDGVRDTFEVLKSYCLLKDDMLNLCELLACFRHPNLFNSLETKVKTALTRLYNKEMVHTFTPSVASKKTRNLTVAESDIYGDQEEVSDQETEENVQDDPLIKVKTKGTSKATKGISKATKGISKATTSSKEKGKTTKGKGKK